jgi:hypothetical protein
MEEKLKNEKINAGSVDLKEGQVYCQHCDKVVPDDIKCRLLYPDKDSMEVEFK